LAGTLEELCDLSWACSGHLRRGRTSGRPSALVRSSPLPVRVQMRADSRLPATAKQPRITLAAGPFTSANTRMTRRWASSSNGPTACGPSGSAMIASAAPTPSQLGSGRPAGLGGGRRRHHGPRQPGRGRHRTYRAAPVTTEDHLSGRAVQWCISARCVPPEECVLARGCAVRPRTQRRSASIRPGVIPSAAFGGVLVAPAGGLGCVRAGGYGGDRASQP